MFVRGGGGGQGALWSTFSFECFWKDDFGRGWKGSFDEFFKEVLQGR